MRRRVQAGESPDLGALTTEPGGEDARAIFGSRPTPTNAGDAVVARPEVHPDEADWPDFPIPEFHGTFIAPSHWAYFLFTIRL